MDNASAASIVGSTSDEFLADDAENEAPGVPLALENTAPIDIAFNNEIKLRVTIAETAGKSGAHTKFKLQYFTSSTFSESVYDAKEIWECTATSTWCYADGGGIDNGVITSKILSDSDTCVGGAGVGCGTHNESATSTSSFTHTSSAATEFEFTIVHAGARINTTYYFRSYDVTNDAAIPLGGGKSYPSLSTEGASITFSTVGVPVGTTTEGIVTDIATSPTLIDFGNLPVGRTAPSNSRNPVKIRTHGPNHGTVSEASCQIPSYSRMNSAAAS